MSKIDIRRVNRVGRVTLTNAGALNALSHTMMQQLHTALHDWADDDDIAMVIIDAEGEKAFCAGGDIQEIYHAGRRGDLDFARLFWAEEYKLNAMISLYPKPYVAMMQGFVMGGGVGISGHAEYRVVCESTRIAMPECAIGLVPDVGGSDILAAAPGHLGEFIGLTGYRMGPGDAIFTGFADYFVPRKYWPRLVARLEDETDPLIIHDYVREPPSAPLADMMPRINAAFSADDIPGIVARLGDAGEWGREVIATLRRQSPLSLLATLRMIRENRADPGIENVLARELRFTWRSVEDSDLLEGIRAAVIDKDRNPCWPDSLDDLPHARDEKMRQPLGENELEIPARTLSWRDKK